MKNNMLSVLILTIVISMLFSVSCFCMNDYGIENLRVKIGEIELTVELDSAYLNDFANASVYVVLPQVFSNFGDDDVQYHKEVKPYHEGHHYGCYTCNTFDATEYHYRDYGRYGASEEQTVYAHVLKAEIASERAYKPVVGYALGGGEGGHESFCELVGVHDAHSAEEARYGKEFSQRSPFRAETLGDDVHGAALRSPSIVLTSHKSADPHPEYRSGAANHECDSYTRYVAKADSRGHNRSECLHRRYLAVAGIFCCGLSL